jgi:hypothetical protein
MDQQHEAALTKDFRAPLSSHVAGFQRGCWVSPGYPNVVARILFILVVKPRLQIDICAVVLRQRLSLLEVKRAFTRQ